MIDQAGDHSSDLGRRVALRRRELGLSRATVADRAGVAEEYLRYLEEHAASPTIGSLTRVAQALDTTIADLTGTRGAVTPGGTAGPGARSTVRQAGELVDLDPEECRRLVAHHAVGRAAVATPEGPAIIPVNYRLVGSEIVFRTAPDAEPPYAEEVAFEVDHIDEAQGAGWSVQIIGRASRVTEPREIEALAGRIGDVPWTKGGREHWVRLRPTRMSGHRIHLTPFKD
ncbi:helix-turn-helix domain-containing protein [Streptomyces hoynatensis]|uniref:Helix-turn-helix domain-containing protein n=1 Tax=Streptomyces hoynatensis TaxID=1141874 RepID=A0A3A9ZBY9_9ACTN|nr:pyridoxamine 5'-phosphate oxidase family protein [Streptomyces hoynatensis]RKN45705.1 helix-turn-helix domain-containing protein [Streptomyces hoynatensis]